MDLATRRPVDVLPDAEGGTPAAWRRAHPGARVIARDRGPQGPEGVARGAPDAAPVADRWHLARNVREALDALQRRRRRAGSPAFRDPAASHLVAAPGGPPPPPRPPPPEPVTPSGAPRRSYRVGPEQWAHARARRAEGASIRAIGRELGVAHKTVRRLLDRPAAPVQEYERPRPGPRAVAPFLPYLRRRWAEGCTNGRQLTRELEALGYAGSGSSVRWLIARWRPPRVPPQDRRPRLRQHGRWLLLRAPERLTAAERTDLRRVLAAAPALAAGHALAQRFFEALRRRDVGAFEGWRAAAVASGLAPFVSLAQGMGADLVAIRKAFRLPWSTGPVEGRVHRLKLRKRQGYGRAGLPLLRARALAAN